MSLYKNQLVLIEHIGHYLFMRYMFYAGIVVSVYFALAESVAAQTDYCRRAIPNAYLNADDMISAADGIYLLRAQDGSWPTESSQAVHKPKLSSPGVNDTPGEPPKLPDFQTELKPVLEGRKSPDRLTVNSRVPFINTQTFTVIERLAGPLQQSVEVKFPTNKTVDSVNFTSDFDKHEAPRFWQEIEIGRASINKQCQIETSFNIGDVYLVFTGLNHPKAFELIREMDDKWLSYIRKSIIDHQSP